MPFPRSRFGLGPGWELGYAARLVVKQKIPAKQRVLVLGPVNADRSIRIGHQVGLG